MYGGSFIFTTFLCFDPLADLTNPSSSEDPCTKFNYSSAPAPRHSGGHRGGQGGGFGGGAQQAAAQSLRRRKSRSVTIRAVSTFYIDLKQSGSKFLKVSKVARRETIIIFDVEDLPKFIEAGGNSDKTVNQYLKSIIADEHGSRLRFWYAGVGEVAEPVLLNNVPHPLIISGYPRSKSVPPIGLRPSGWKRR